VKYKDPEWLEEKYKEHSASEMAEMAGCCTSTICKYMEKHGLERDSYNQPKDGKHKDKEWLEKKYVEEQLSQKEISNIVGVSKGNIKYWLEKHDIPIRSKSDAAKIRAERYPHTTEAGAKALKEADVNAWELWNEEQREEFRQQLSEERMGEDNPMWDRTGSDHPRWKEDKAPHRFYQSKEWQETRQEVLERDNHECQACGETENLHVHHITPVSAGGPRYELNNLVTLCDTHHREWEGLYLRPDNRGGN